jgi:hypothetical protein
LFNDRPTTVGTALMVGAWIVTGAALVAMWLTNDLRIGFTTTVVLGVASCLTCREIIVGQRDRLWNAFDLGRDAGREKVSRLRRD